MRVESLEPAKAAPQTNRLQWIVAVLLLATVLLAANRRLVSGADCPKWDADMFFAPFQMLVADHARAGTFLLWNPWLNGGSPDYAEPQIGSFSPFAVILGLLTGGTEAGFRVYWLTIWLWGGVGVILLGRHLGAPAWGACAIALGFVFSGFYTGHAEHTSTLYTISWLPFIVWRLDVALVTRRLRPAVEAGAAWGLSALGGYPGWVLMNACFAGLWAVGRWCCPERSQSPKTGLKHVATMLAAMALVGFIILLPPYAAFMVEGSSYSERSRALARDHAVEDNALHPGALSTFASPYLSMLKAEGNPTLWDYTDISTTSVYLGVVVPVLALVALFGGRGDRWRLWLALVVLLFVGFALGRSLPLRAWLYDFVPPTRYFRHAGMFRAYAMFGAVVLALLGARDIVSNGTAAPRISRGVATLACLASAAAVLVYYAVMWSVAIQGSKFALANWHLWVMWPGIAVIFWLGCFIGRLPGTLVDSSLTLSRQRLLILFVPASLLAVGIIDALLTANLSAFTIREEGNCRVGWARMSSNQRASLDLMPSGLQRQLRTPEWAVTYPGNTDNKNLPLKIATLANYAPFFDRFHSDLIQRPTLVSMATGNDRIWFSSSPAIIHPTDAAYAAWAGRTEQLGKPVLVVHRRDWLLSRTKPGEAGPNDIADVAAISALPAAEGATATLRAYSPREMTLDVFCPTAGWVLVTDRWARGWRGTVNGKPTEVWGGNFIFRAMPVQQGKNEIRFEYHPVGYPALVISSWMTIALVIFWTVWSKRST